MPRSPMPQHMRSGQVDKLGQMLVREIQELAKKSDNEKTQRTCMQR